MIKLENDLEEVVKEKVGTATKVKLRENITGNQKTKWFTFTENQLKNERYKKHLEKWKEKLRS